MGRGIRDGRASYYMDLDIIDLKEVYKEMEEVYKNDSMRLYVVVGVIIVILFGIILF